MKLKLFLILFLFIGINIVHSANRQFTFNVKYSTAAPDGVIKKDKVLTTNGLFPGPPIIVNANDTITVKVINSIQDGQNTSIHWHGIHQRGTPYEDGTNMIAQCPGKAGGYQTYTFPAPIPGTYWYHSHVKSQYTEGLWGPLIVKAQREIYTYDDEFIIMISDWYHRPADELEEWHLSKHSKGSPPYPYSALINGHGRTNCTVARTNFFNCDPTHQRRPVFTVIPGKTYRIRVINVSGYAGFRFSIDNHKLHAIEVDAVDVRRTPGLDVVVIASAQRYSFLVTMNQPLARYVIRADLMTEILFNEGENINSGYKEIMPLATAVLDYQTTPANPAITSTTEPFDFTAPLPPAPNMSNPLYLNDDLLHAYDGKMAPGDFDKEIVLNVSFEVGPDHIRRGALNNISFSLPTDKPLLLKMLGNETFDPQHHALELNYMEVVQVVINNPFDGRHPFHFHGHSFWVMGTGKEGDGDYDKCKHNLVFDGVRRDTTMVYQRSWVVIRFVADNPGLWALHCHIDWHNLSGMAAVFVEAPEMARKVLRLPAEALRVCAQHNITLSRGMATG